MLYAKYAIDAVDMMITLSRERIHKNKNQSGPRPFRVAVVSPDKCVINHQVIKRTINNNIVIAMIGDE